MNRPALLKWRDALIRIENNVTFLGRDTGCHICIDDEQISRRHALIIRVADEFVLMDLQSRNGVRINGRRVACSKLKPGDVIRLGEQTLEFRLPDDSPAPLPGNPAFKENNAKVIRALKERKFEPGSALGALTTLLDAQALIFGCDDIENLENTALEQAMLLTGADSAWYIEFPPVPPDHPLKFRIRVRRTIPADPGGRRFVPGNKDIDRHGDRDSRNRYQLVCRAAKALSPAVLSRGPTAAAPVLSETGPAACLLVQAEQAVAGFNAAQLHLLELTAGMLSRARAQSLYRQALTSLLAEHR